MTTRLEKERAILDELEERVSQLKTLDFIQLKAFPQIDTQIVPIFGKRVRFTTHVLSVDHERIAVAVRSDERRFGFTDAGTTQGFFITVENHIIEMSSANIQDYLE